MVGQFYSSSPYARRLCMPRAFILVDDWKQNSHGVKKGSVYCLLN